MDFDTLNSKRASQLSQLSKTHNAIKEFKDGSLSQLKTFRERLKNISVAHESFIDKMLDLKPLETGKCEDDAMRFRDKYSIVLGELEDKISLMEGESPPSNRPVQPQGQINEVETLRIAAEIDEKRRADEIETQRLINEREDKRRSEEREEENQRREQELKGYKAVLQNMQSQLEKQKAFISSYTAESVATGSVIRRRDATVPLVVQYAENFNQACRLCGEEGKTQLLASSEEFQDTYNAIIDWFEDTIAKRTPIPFSSGSPSLVSSHNLGIEALKPRIQLPAIELPKFDGSPDLWINFRDTFKSMVHNNDQLSGSNKFRYLKMSITDKSSPVALLPESDDGYDEAWELVLKQYDDKRKMMERHIQAILSIKRMQAEDCDDLQQLVNDVKIHIAALKRLLPDVDLFEAFVAYYVGRRLNEHTRDVIETDGTLEIPVWTDLCKGIEKRIKVLNTMPKQRQQASKTMNNIKPSAVTSTSSKPAWRSNSLVAHKSSTAAPAPTTKYKMRCYMCSEEHRLSQCQKFLNLVVHQRVTKCEEWKICKNCFGSHGGEQCQSLATCRTCHQKHNTLLHPTSTIDQGPSQKTFLLQRLDQASSQEPHTQLSPDAHSFNANATCSASLSSLEAMTLLSTAIVKIRDAYGNWHEARALLDSGSDANFITNSAAQALKIPLRQTNVQASGLGQNSMTIHHTMSALIASRDEKFRQSLDFLVTNKITGLTPSHPVTMSHFEVPTGLILADPTFHVPGKIDMLIGNELFMDLLLTGRIKTQHGPILQESVLGWIIAGKLTSSQVVATTRCHLNTLSDLRTTMEKFYNDENYKNSKGFLTEEEKYCEEVFEQTHQRSDDGRFTVKIPLKSNVNQLANNYGIAYHQFLANEKRLQKNERLKTETVKFLREYEELGHMTEIQSHPDDRSPAYYLPHHAVEKPESTTTSVRIVFNASSKTKSGLSFNDVQCIGPQIQSDGFTLCLKFRQHSIVIKADIAKMYRQIEVNPEQRHLQRILWREDPSKQLKTYELKTVTYGTASASFQSTRCLKQLAIECRSKFPHASDEIENSFYVDDLISGAKTDIKAIKLFKEIDSIVSSGAMKLRKISSNSETFLRSVPEGDRERSNDEDMTIKALGIKWNPTTDKILIDVNAINVEKLTKRNVLSEIAKIYDPEGLLGPVVFRFKLFMKTVWQLKTSWDEQLPAKETEEWEEITRNIIELRKIRIARHVMISTFVKIEMHGFSDASDQGYGAAIYIRSEDSNGNRACHLICAKSRIAPTERRSTARLELCGGVVLANLMQQVEKAFIFKLDKKFCWMDSAIALHWLKKSPSQLQPFVANRVSEIQELSKDITWRHVRGEDNPADMISRGLLPEEIINNNMWWHGPAFLMSQESQWPASIVTIDPEEPAFKAEFKKIHSLTVTKSHVEQDTNPFITMIENSSRLYTIKKQLAPIMRFIFNVRARKNNKQKRTGPIRAEDILDAETSLARIYQTKMFPDDIAKLRSGNRVARNSRLKNLDPFWDSHNQLIRVGGRLKNAHHFNMNQKHPIVLPRCHLTTLIVRETHQRQLHSGQQATLGHVMMKFWPLHGKSTIRKELHKCVKCFRARPKMIQQFMGQLPEPRITPAPPFFNTGIDYAGPFHIKVGLTRNAKICKSYVALFVCLATKAIHLEIVSDLTTQAFLAALSRFISRRGLSKNIFSDHGTNFVGAKNELQDFSDFLKKTSTQQAICNHLLKQEINWHFIPPRAPEHGGLWEAGVKSMKYHLTRVLQEAHLTFEELYTLTCSVEAVLNSRPLMQLSLDPNDEEALTAGHILIGRPLTTFPRHDIQELQISRLHRWDRVLQFQQQFWTRWCRDYLHHLQVRTKNYKEETAISIGQMVLVDVDNCPPLDWPIGRITSIQPGKDGITRVASIKTAKGNYDRPVNKLALLPIDDNEQLFVAQDVNQY